MPNINKVVYGGQTLIDLTDSTLTAANQIANGVTAYDRSGTKLTGTLAVDSTYSITKTLTHVSSSADDTKVIAGNSFFTELVPDSGYVISSITVTMGGEDITDQVFKSGTGAKTVTVNGTYAASDDNLSGYTAISVNVPSGSATLGTKSISSNGTYNASSDGYDGYSQVTVNVSGGITPVGTKYINISSNGTTTEDVTYYETASITTNVPNSYTSSDEGKVVSNGALVSQGSDTVTQNGTVDTTLISSLTVNVSSGGGINYKTGTYTPSQTYNATGNRAITTIANIGFTPKRFIFNVSDKSKVSGTQYAIIHEEYDEDYPLRVATRYSNTSNTLSISVAGTSWTTQTNYYLYLNSGTIYIRTTSAFILVKDVEYTWYAYG